MGEAKRKRNMNQSDTGGYPPPISNTGGKSGNKNPSTETFSAESEPDGAYSSKKSIDRYRLNLSISQEIAGLLDEASKALGLSASQIALSVLLHGLPSIRSQIDAVNPKRAS